MRKIGIALGGGHAFGVPVLFILIFAAILINKTVSKKSDPMYLTSI